MVSSSKLIYTFSGVVLGYLLGSQHALFSSQYDSMATTVSIRSPQVQSLDKFKSAANVGSVDDPNVYKLHSRVQLSEDPELFANIVNPLVQNLMATGKSNCSEGEVDVYFDILKNIEENPSFYEDTPNNTNQTCPLVFMFYFEGGIKLVQSFFTYYSNIQTKRCMKFIVSKRWKDHNETMEIMDNHGYEMLPGSAIQQGRTIINGLNATFKKYGDEVVVSINDLDHLMVWFDLEGKPHRYSSYTDMVRLYMYEFLATRGCPDKKNVHERYVIPCTCLMKNNTNYVAVPDGDVLWSQYGLTNRFHPTANFYLNNTLEKYSLGHDVGTVYSNLRNMKLANINVHHKIGRKTKKTVTRATMVGMIHARTDNMIQSLAKYQHFLKNSLKNAHRDSESTIADAMKCSIVSPEEMIYNVKTCRSVKEFSNILAIGHQKLACLNAGYSEEHCLSDMSCCVTD